MGLACIGHGSPAYVNHKRLRGHRSKCDVLGRPVTAIHLNATKGLNKCHKRLMPQKAYATKGFNKCHKRLQ